MPIPILQCGECKFNLRQFITEDNFPGVSICDQYPEPKGAPEFVMDGSKDCPKYGRA